MTVVHLDAAYKVMTPESSGSPSPCGYGSGMLRTHVDRCIPQGRGMIPCSMRGRLWVMVSACARWLQVWRWPGLWAREKSTHTVPVYGHSLHRVQNDPWLPDRCPRMVDPDSSYSNAEWDLPKCSIIVDPAPAAVPLCFLYKQAGICQLIPGHRI